eukprot:403339960
MKTIHYINPEQQDYYQQYKPQNQQQQQQQQYQQYPRLQSTKSSSTSIYSQSPYQQQYSREPLSNQQQQQQQQQSPQTSSQQSSESSQSSPDKLAEAMRKTIKNREISQLSQDKARRYALNGLIFVLLITITGFMLPDTFYEKFDHWIVRELIIDNLKSFLFALVTTIAYTWPVTIIQEKNVFYAVLAVNSVTNYYVFFLRYLIVMVIIGILVIVAFFWMHILIKFLKWVRDLLKKLKMHRQNILKKHQKYHKYKQMLMLVN